MKKMTLVLAAVLCAVPILAQPKLKADNVEEVLKAMTLEEKATLCVGMSGNRQALVPGAAGQTRAIPRLGIPAISLPDGPAGIRIDPTRRDDSRTYYGTGFPVGTAIASSWDVDMVRSMTAAMGNEVLEYGADILLAPGMNIHRNPLCGRNFEYFSEDPVLTGKIAAAYVQGIQSNGVGSTIKHYAANNQELNRNENSSEVSARALREIYLKGFEIAVKEADPWAVMSSYNKINGEYTQQSHDLLTKVLRDEWGYEGTVMTDWGNKAATAKAAAAGNDLMMPGSQVEIDRIIEGVKNGELSEEQLDKNVRNILNLIVKTPHFRNYGYSDTPDLKAHAEAARKAATESMVLLKNEGKALPLKDIKKIALFGASSIDFVAGGTGSGNVNKKYVIDMVQGLENAGFELNEGLKDYYRKYVDFSRVSPRIGGTSASGAPFLGQAKISEAPVSRSYIDGTVAQNDIAVIVIGRNSGEGGDRRVDNDFNITDTERQLLNDVCNAYHLAGKQVVAVLNIGGAIETASWKHLPDAILLAWQPGQEGGDAVADVLTGKVNPSGRLPMTFPMEYMDHPSSLNFPKGTESRGNRNWGGAANAQVKNLDYTDYEEDIWVGYRHFTTRGAEVSYPFGYGLSYTEFEYVKPTVKTTADGLTASVTVKNTGDTAGREVVEIFVSAPEGGLTKPSRELKAFAKTRLLAPGETQTLTFNISAYDLASFNQEANQWETAAGEYRVYFSRNADCTSVSAPAKIKKAQTYKVSEAFVK